MMLKVLIFGMTSPLINDCGHAPWEGFVQLFQVRGMIFFLTFFSPIWKMIPFRLLFAICKPFKLQQRDCNRVVDLLTEINLLFLFFL